MMIQRNVNVKDFEGGGFVFNPFSMCLGVPFSVERGLIGPVSR